MYEGTPEVDWQGDFGIVRYGNDKHLNVMFFMKSVHNPMKSAQHGARYHDEVAYVRIQHPGENIQVIERPVNDSDKTRFAKQWEQFSKNAHQTVDGIPIDLLFPTHPNIADNLRSHGIHTIEQCANMSAHAVDSIGMGSQDYKNRATDYLEAASAGSNYHKFTTTLDGYKRENEHLKKQIVDLQLQFMHLTSQIQRGMPIPAAMMPQQGIPGLANFQPVQTPTVARGPNRGADTLGLEVQPPAVRRDDLMAEIPAGKITKPWKKRDEDER